MMKTNSLMAKAKKMKRIKWGMRTHFVLAI
jgi:hypothetical protein